MTASRQAILLVDDEEQGREYLSEVLRYLGYATETADSAEPALRLVESRPAAFSVVITDFRMPGYNGIELIERIRKLPVSPPVILLTGYADIKLAVASLRSGAFDLLTKPVNFQDLRQAVDRALRYSRLLDLERQFARELEESITCISGALKENEEKLAALTAQLSSAEEQERRRIATELHDNIGISLAFSKMKLLKLCEDIERPEQRAVAESALDSLDSAITSVRALTTQISPPLLYEVGLEAAVECLADNLNAEHGLAVETAFGKVAVDLPEEERALLFQAIRELLVNVIKHSGVDRARVAISREAEGVVVEVSDRGCGFDDSLKPNGFGLFSIKQKMLRANGSFTISGNSGGGTFARLVLPIPVPDDGTLPQEATWP